MDNEEIEIKVLLEAIRLKYGYDFRQYADASLTRRIKKGLAETSVENVSDMIPHIIHDKSLIYATDFNDKVLQKAKKGIYSNEDIKKSTLNYQKAGGKNSFASYYHADDSSVIFKRSLKKNIVFANHNLVTDSVFGEMNLIFCRNVLIYFNNDLQNRVLNLFKNSLCNNGFLCLGSRESIKFSSIADSFIPVVKKHRIFQKKSKSTFKEQ